MTTPPTRDAASVQSSYSEPTTLRSRADLFRYRRSSTNLHDVVADLLDVQAGDHVLDLGCGESPYLDLVARKDPSLLLGLDTSLEMLERSRDHVAAPSVVRASLDALPVRRRAWDVVLAAHSLYHADDPATVLARLPFLLRPGGRLCLILNGRNHLCELRRLATSAGHPGLLGESARFTADDVLTWADRRHDPAVTWLRDELVVPAEDPLVAYVDSTRRIYEPRLDPCLSWEAMLDEFVSLARALIDDAGPIRIRTETAVIRCS
jgi:SAM-dependent methyltransferase